MGEVRRKVSGVRGDVSRELRGEERSECSVEVWRREVRMEGGRDEQNKRKVEKSRVTKRRGQCSTAEEGKTRYS